MAEMEKHEHNCDCGCEDEGCEAQIVMLDEEPFEIIDSLVYKDNTYLALIPYVEDEDEETEECEFVILKEVEEDGEYSLATVDDDELYSELGEAFIKHFDEIFAEEE